MAVNKFIRSVAPTGIVDNDMSDFSFTAASDEKLLAWEVRTRPPFFGRVLCAMLTAERRSLGFDETSNILVGFQQIFS